MTLRCNNAWPGTYGHECGKPAEIVGTRTESGRQVGLCADCYSKAMKRIPDDLRGVPTRWDFPSGAVITTN